MKTLTTDFIGFSYNGIHSSDLGIIRTSDGSRFNENLLPTSQDKVVQVPGQSGSYFFGSQYTQQQFNIAFAFDELTEQQLNTLSYILGDKKIHPLVFDERPYKTYMAKVTGNTLIKHIPFSHDYKKRIYKGEGSIQFTCYDVYAHCDKKFWGDYYNEIPDITEAQKEEAVLEWNYAANLLKNNAELGDDKKIDIVLKDGNNNKYINLYNPGIKQSPFTFEVKAVDGKFSALNLSIDNDSFKLKEFSAKDNPAVPGSKDTLITINSKTKLIEGWTEVLEGTITRRVRSGNIYNEYISSGDFLQIPITVTFNNGTVKKDIKTMSIISDDENLDNFNIKYYYYYY